MARFVPVLLLLLASTSRLSAGPYDDLLKLVPPDANTLVLVDVKGAFASPLGKSEKWAEDYFHRYRAGIGFIPVDAEAVVIASEVNLNRLTRDYEVGLVKVRNMPNMKDLAARLGGSLDRLSDQVAVLSPQDVYYIGLPGEVFAGVYPAHRQAAARWVRGALQAKGGSLSPYLKQAADGAAGNTLTIAVDLADCADPTLLRAALPASPVVVRQQNVNVELVAKFIASVKGMTVNIKVSDGIMATVRVDFGFEVDLYKRIARELFLELLDTQGVAIPAMSAWETTYGKNSMTLSGTLRPTDLRRILSLFSFPGPTGADDPKVTPGKVSVPATKRYLGAVEVVLEELRRAKDSPDYLKTATWNEKAAEQIDQLDPRAVDPIALGTAREVSKRLRAIAGSLRGVPINLDDLKKQVYLYGWSNNGWGGGWWGFNPGWLGGGGVSTNLLQIRADQQKVIADNKKQRAEVWIQIDEILASARQKLTDEYKTPFGP